MERPKCFPDAGQIDMELDSSDDGADIAQEGSAFPQALLDADVSHGHDVALRL